MKLRFLSFLILSFIVTKGAFTSDAPRIRLIAPFNGVSLIDIVEESQWGEILQDEITMLGMGCGIVRFKDEQLNNQLGKIGEDIGLYTLPEDQFKLFIETQGSWLAEQATQTVLNYLQAKRSEENELVTQEIKMEATNKRSHEKAFDEENSTAPKRQKMPSLWSDPNNLQLVLKLSDEPIFLDINELSKSDLDNQVLLEGILQGKIKTTLITGEELTLPFFEGQIGRVRSYLAGQMQDYQFMSKHKRLPNDMEKARGLKVYVAEKYPSLIALRLLMKLPLFAAKISHPYAKNSSVARECGIYADYSANQLSLDAVRFCQMAFMHLFEMHTADISQFITKLSDTLDTQCPLNFNGLFKIDLILRTAIPKHIIYPFQDVFPYASESQEKVASVNRLSLELHGNTLKKCLDHFFAQENANFAHWDIGGDTGIVEGGDGEHNLIANVEGVQQIFLADSVFPPYLRIELKRFKENSYGTIIRQKEAVSFPLELNLAEYSQEVPKHSSHYELLAFIVHHGEANAGKYWIYAKDIKTSKWYLYGHDWYREVHEDEIKNIANKGREREWVLDFIHPDETIEQRNNLPYELIYKKK